MSCTAYFRFHDALNDFLKEPVRNTQITYSFHQAPSIKDAIEAIGIPHTEVNLILANNSPVTFSYLLQDGDKIEVHPYGEKSEPINGSSTKCSPSLIKFICDVHLGRLAKALRMLGFDTAYKNNFTDKVIVQIAQIENRIVLTRDVGLLKNKSVKVGYWLRSQHLEEQLAEVIKRFKVEADFNSFTRCLSCNGTIAVVTKESILQSIPANTKEYFNEFYQCGMCKRVYWKGSRITKG